MLSTTKRTNKDSHEYCCIRSFCSFKVTDKRLSEMLHQKMDEFLLQCQGKRRSEYICHHSKDQCGDLLYYLNIINGTKTGNTINVPCPQIHLIVEIFHKYTNLTIENFKNIFYKGMNTEYYPTHNQRINKLFH